jgi:DNA repair protein RadC
MVERYHPADKFDTGAVAPLKEERMSLVKWADGEGPRDKLLARGPGSLSDAELLAVVLRTGYKGYSAVQAAQALIVRFDSLGGVLGADRRLLLESPGVGSCTYAVLRASTEMARRQALEPLSTADVLASPQQTRKFLQLHLGSRSREVFSCLFLDSQHRMIRCDDMFLGTLDGAAVYPREVVIRALQYRSAAVIFAHNHPSGVAEPSSADKRITQRLQAALELLDIRVLDHIIVGRGTEFSFAEEGLL